MRGKFRGGATAWRLLVALLVMCGSLAPAAAADQKAADDGGNADSVTTVSPFPPGTLAVSDEQREADVREWERSHERASEDERRRSASAYAGLSGDDASALGAETFPEYFSALDAPVLASEGDRVLSEVNENVALVRPEGSDESQLAVSSAPLFVDGADGKKVLADTTLREVDGGFAPSAVGVDLTFPDDLRRGLALGQDSGSVGFNLVGASGDSQAIPLKDGGLIYSSARPDTDLILSPVVGGFRLGAQIRSESSPEEFAFDLDLPEGARLEAGPDGQGAAVFLGEEQLLEISPTTAIDADGRPVATTMRTEGDRLILELSHRENTPHFPILLDPVVLGSNLTSDDFFDTDPSSASTGSRGWAYWEGYQDIYGGVYAQPNNYLEAYISSWSGLSVWAVAPNSWNARTHGAYYESVPNWAGTGSTSAYYNYVKFDTPTLNAGSSPVQEPRLDFGLFNWNTGLYTDRLYFIGSTSYPQYWIGPTSGRSDAQTPQRINFDMTTSGYGVTLSNSSDNRIAFLSGITTYIADKESPSVISSSQSPADVNHHWIKTPPTTASLTYTAADQGLGIQHLKFKAGISPSQTPVSQSQPMLVKWPAASVQPYSPAIPPPATLPQCEGWHFFTACPQQPGPKSFQFNATQLNQGINTLYAEPVDAVEKSIQTNAGKLKIDTTGPSVSVTGGLKNPTNPGRDLHVEATDGSPSSNATARSGVVEAKLVVDDPQPGQPNQKKTLFTRTQDNWTGQHGLMDSAPLEPSLRDFTLRRSDGVQNGSRQFTLTVTDEAGNETSVQWTQTIDFSPTLDLSGSLKEASDNDYDVDGPTKLRIQSDATGGESSVTDLQAEVSKNGGPFQQVWNFHKACNSNPPCSLDERYFHFPERFGRGDFDLRITARDEGGSTKSKTISFHQDEPRTGELRQFTFEDFRINDRQVARVNVANGNLLLEADDIEIAGTGLSNSLMRSYNSLDTDNGEFGPGWSFSTATGLRLDEQSNGDVWFRGPTGYRVLFEKRSDGTYNDPVGVDAKLTKKSGNDGWELRLSGSEELYEFNNAGELDKHLDKNEHKITYTRSNGEIQKITDTQGNSAGSDPEHELNFTHVNGKITKITDGANREWKYAYTAGLLTKYTDPEGAETSYVYDGHERLVAIVDPMGNRTEVDYLQQDDNFGRGVQEIRLDADDQDNDNAANFATTYIHDSGNATCAQGGQNLSVISEDSSSGDPTEPNHTPGNQTIYCNDPKTQVDKTKDARGLTSDGTYNARGNLQSYSRGVGGAGGATTLNFNSSSNRLESTTTSTGTGADLETSLTYNNSSFRPATSTDTQGNQKKYGYDGAGNLTSVQVVDGGSTDQSVIRLDRYDDSDPDYLPILKGLVRRSKVDVGNPSGTDPETVKTRYVYNGAGDIEEVQPPDPQGAISYETDILNRIAEITDANGNERQIFYDKLDRVTEIRYESSDPDVAYRFTRYDYDDNGNLKSRTDGTKMDDNSEADLAVDTFSYDARNQLKGDMLRNGAQHIYIYDRVGNLIRLTDSPGQASEQNTVYAYNQVNLLTRIWEPGANTMNDSEAIRYEYEDENQANPKSNNIVSVTYPGAVRQEFTRDKADRITAIEVIKNPQTQNPVTLVDQSWDYGDSGLRESFTDHLRGTGNGVTTDYTYDYLNRLTCATEDGSGGETWRYSYNNASELLWSEHDGVASCAAQGGSSRKTFQHNDAHEITSTSGDDYDYDDQGNLLGIENGLSFTYNDRNQTTSMQGPGTGGPYGMTYAGEGQSDRLSAGDTDFTANLLGTGYETDGSTRYDYTRDDAGNPVGLRSGSDNYYLIRDSIGSVVAMVKENGTVAGTYRYDPYGKITSDGPGGSPTVDNPYTFAGYYRDDETGLYKAGERYYDPSSSTWTQKDPLSQIQSPNEANPYVYAGADPVNRVDPSGTIGLGTCDVGFMTVGCVTGVPEVFSDAASCYLPGLESYEAGAYGFAFGFGIGSQTAYELGIPGGIGVGAVSGAAGAAASYETAEAYYCISGFFD